ncbi:MAG: flagellar biosynthesis anti-sigma factor FlgM [Enterovibrio sp.]
MASIEHLRANQNLNANNTVNSKTSKKSATQEALPHVASEQHKDEFVMSEQTKALNKLNQQITQSSAFDSQKVEALKAAIANGSYKVDPDRLASNILKHETKFNEFN